MSRIWEAIGTKLNAATAVTGIVGARIYHGVRPQQTGASQTALTPSVNYFEISGDPVLANGVVKRREYQVSCYAADQDTVKRLSEAVELEFQLVAETVGTFAINFCQVVQSGGLLYESDVGLFHVPLTVRVIYNADET